MLAEALEKPQSRGWPEQGAGSQLFASTFTLTLHVRGQPWSTLGFLCILQSEDSADVPGSCAVAVTHLCHRNESARRLRQLLPTLKHNRTHFAPKSAPKIFWLNQLFQCTSHVSALSLMSLMVPAQGFVVGLWKSPEKGVNSNRVHHGQAHWKGLTLSKARHQ